ncbi:hypothetical protein [Bradyrhizobium sp. RT10b]|uniref:pPIWI-associating nuclease domain-containing protein n=1 Tax=Bradyrhizobium sp. RT10b TaxID=3156331 RepID=UPI0033944B38
MSKQDPSVGAECGSLPSWPELRKQAFAFLREFPDDGFMPRVLEGALHVGESNNAIRGNLCALALREITGHLLHTWAPDTRVSNCCWYNQEANTERPTRQQRATYIVQGGLPVAFVTDTLQLDHDAVCRPLIKAMDRLNKATHVREKTLLTDDAAIRALVDAALNSLIDLFKAARDCQQEVHRQLAGEIHDAVLDTFLGETLQELDELSTHTLFDYHQTEDIQVMSIDDELIHLKVSGTVYVDLQYGSNSDMRNDMGAVISDSYPYTARLQSKARSPGDILKDTVDVSVDNSSFFE